MGIDLKVISKHWPVILITVFALLVSLVYYSPPLKNKSLIDDDVFQHLFWMDQFSDQSLFENDLLTEYAKAIQPIAPAGIYRISHSVVDPVYLSKMLPIPLFVLSVILIFLVGVRLGGRFNGVLCAATLMATPGYLIKMEGGLPRSFALPLLLLFLLLILRKKYMGASGVIVLQALIYPLIAPICLLILGARMLFPFSKISRPQLKKSLLPLAIACISGLALFVHQKTAARNADIGSPVTSTEVRNNPVFLPGGRYPVEQQYLPAITHNIFRGTFYSKLPDVELSGIGDLERSAYKFVFLGLFIGVTFLMWYKDVLRIDSTLRYLIITSVIMYSLAYFFMLKLYIPTRQLEFTIPIWALLIQSMVISKGITLLRTPRVKNAIRLVLICGTVLVGGLMVRTSILPSHFSKRELVDVSQYAALYEALHELPSNCVIASHPSLADPIPTMTGRKVLFNTSMAHPLFKNYWARIESRAKDFAFAYYSESIGDVIDFCREYKVDFIIVKYSDFSGEYLGKSHRTWEPYNTWERTAFTDKKDFALLNISDESKIFVDEQLFVVSVRLLGLE